MGLKPDSWIREKSLKDRMITPFVNELHTNGMLSYGLSAYGYDIRVDREFQVFDNAGSEGFIDPKRMRPDQLHKVVQEHCIIPGNSFALAKSHEIIIMPDDCIALLKCKSTYIRAGMCIPGTVLEPGWKGHITLELANLSPMPVKVYAMEGIAQLMFWEGDAPPEITYAQRNGKYQDQSGIVLPHV